MLGNGYTEQRHKYCAQWCKTSEVRYQMRHNFLQAFGVDQRDNFNHAVGLATFSTYRAGISNGNIEIAKNATKNNDENR